MECTMEEGRVFNQVEKKQGMIIEENEIVKAGGGAALAGLLIGFAADIAVMIWSSIQLAHSSYILGGILLGASILVITVLGIMCAGFKVLNPNEALVLTLFGRYYGTIKQPGFYYVNPFCTAVNPAAKTNISIGTGLTDKEPVNATITNKKISTKVLTLNNERQKVNDVLGNPVIIGAVVIWKVKDPTKAVFQVENYKTYLSTQCDSTIRNIARLYPYDDVDEEGEQAEKTLRGSSQEIAEGMTRELQSRVEDAGLEVMEVRITHLSYAEEIAAAMLQRQ